MVHETHYTADSVTPIHEPIYPSTFPLVFGSFNGTDLFYRGQVDEVRIWNYARSAQQIACNYNLVLDPSSPGLVGNWHFDEAIDAQQIQDSSPFANHGTRGSTASTSGDDPVRTISSAPLMAACSVDFTCDRVVTVGDIFAFLATWFTGAYPDADFDGNVVINVADIFAFLAAWFAGCP